MTKFDYDSLNPETLDKRTISEVIRPLECDISWTENSLTRISRYSVAEVERAGSELKRFKSLRKKFIKFR